MTTDTSRYGPATALVVVDMQNDFVHPDGSLYVQGGAEVVQVVNAEITAARAAGSPVVYTLDWHPPETPHFAEHGGTWPPHCVRDTWGAQLHDDLLVDDEPLVVRKGTGMEDGYSGFTVHDLATGSDQRTELHGMLQERGVERVVVVGVATDVCVRATALDSVNLGYHTEVVPEATAAVELESGDLQRALEEMAASGVAMVQAAA